MSVRGVPVQDLPENQDPDVAHTVDAMTGEKIPLKGAKKAEAPKREAKSSGDSAKGTGK